VSNEDKVHIGSERTALISLENKKLCHCRGTARGTCQILQLQNISLEN